MKALIRLAILITLASLRAADQAPSDGTFEVQPVPSLPVVRSMDALDDKHRLAAGDRLSFTILEDEEDPVPLLVTDSGDVEVPYIGRFPALDKTCKQLATEIRTELEKKFYYKATVIIGVDVLSRTRGRVYLFGAVRIPGPREIPSDEVFTLSKAILMSGSFAEFADRKRVKVTRAGETNDATAEILVINVADILEKGQLDQDIVLEPGDLIFVPTKAINF